jgi:hypothetical protein
MKHIFTFLLLILVTQLHAQINPAAPGLITTAIAFRHTVAASSKSKSLTTGMEKKDDRDWIPVTVM